MGISSGSSAVSLVIRDDIGIENVTS